jgi:hypothetical protein
MPITARRATRTALSAVMRRRPPRSR